MNRTGWIATSVSAVVALLLGFTIGWFGNQAYIRASLNAAFEDIGADMEESLDVPEDMEAMEGHEDDPGAAAEPEEEIPDAVPMSESASDGIWDMAITGVERTTQINGSYSNATAADGREFVVLTVELTNASQGPQFPEIDGSELVDVDGNRYAYDMDAVFALDDDDVMYTEVNPGGSAVVPFPFEVGEGTEVEMALLTASWDAPDHAAILVEE
ncbi:hypothetical protein SUDANB121_00933 [Nocardiopsis dassonvillei]|uniref:DUF4352 domain-containing protein n=1 Tax=Nocardiopsis dassonvillei TaxID=2014 RepID=UPI003F56E218